MRLTLLSDGSAAPRSRSYTIPANSRFTVGVHADFPDVTGGYGCLVESLGDVPAEIVVERAMYSDSNGVFWAAGTNVWRRKFGERVRSRLNRRARGGARARTDLERLDSSVAVL